MLLSPEDIPLNAANGSTDLRAACYDSFYRREIVRRY